MRYKGMVAHFEYIASVRMYVGEIINCPDVVSFGATSLLQLKQVMEDAVDGYLDYRKLQLSEHASATVLERY
tara:strand:+ start:143 stop:358 length:216 start_codon:yes stop_codon:yes gene_type:complete